MKNLFIRFKNASMKRKIPAPLTVTRGFPRVGSKIYKYRRSRIFANIPNVPVFTKYKVMNANTTNLHTGRPYYSC